MTDPFAAMAANASKPQTGSGSMLSSVNNDKPNMGIRMIIGGVEKMGKTTLACSAPRPLLVPLELGYASMNVAKTRVPENLADVMNLIEEVKQASMKGQFPFKSLIFDTATALERLIDLRTIADDSSKANLTMETAHGGYGKAYAHSNMLFDKFTKACDELAMYGGINVVLTCHVFAARAIDPSFGEFDTWDLLLHSPKDQKKHGKREMATQWADFVGFLHEPFFITKGEDDRLAKATSLGRGRVLGTTRVPQYVAGNRYGVTGEIAIPDPNSTQGPTACGWNHIAHAIHLSRGLDFYNRDAF